MSSTPLVRSREITASDLEGIVDLLTMGFKRDRDRLYWSRAIRILEERHTPAGFPKFGYLLESDSVPVGVLLLIFSAYPNVGGTRLRCNVSSWYVKPSFRSYAPLLARQATRYKDVTYLNISASPHTWPMLEAQGYQRFSNGIYVSIPALCRSSAKLQIRPVHLGACQNGKMPSVESELLSAHAGYGGLSVICESDGKQFPFVFGLRRKYKLPFAHLIYCHDQAQFVRFAGSLGRFLANRGFPLVVLDSSGPIRGLPGAYIDGKPKYYKGSAPVQLGDLAYTERVMFGY